MAYIGKELSVNALIAFRHCEKPISSFKHSDKVKALGYLKAHQLIPTDYNISIFEFKNFLKEYGKSSWHHIGELYDKVEFYSFPFTISNKKVKEYKCLTDDLIDKAILQDFIDRGTTTDKNFSTCKEGQS